MQTPNLARKPFLEIACFDLESAVNAARGGADRIELCQDYASGGLTPDTSTLVALKSQLSIPIFVMIRPHSRNFYYSDTDFEDMKISLETLKNHGADGFVFGILKQPETCADGGWIDVERNKKLVQLADGRPCTFHRAFDCIPESCWDVTLTNLIACGFSSILTSGGSLGKSATDHICALKSLSYHKMVATSHQTIDIIIGGGVRSTNIQLLWRNTNAKSFHSSALVEHGNIVSTDEVSKLRDLLQSCNLENMESGNY